MTATFNSEYQSLLESMIGFKLLAPNTFWARQSSFEKRHIHINIKYSTQHFRLMKEYLITHLASNSTHKAIIVTNTALRASQCKNELNNWLDTHNKLHGDCVLVVGDRDPELKFAYTTAFTNNTFDSTIPNTSNALQPRFLIGTSGCIGAGLDCSDVHLVMRLGLSTNITNFIQEMGQCGRIPNDSPLSSYSDHFNIVFSIQDFLYIHKRIHVEDKSETTTTDINELSISREYIKSLELRNYMKLCSMLFLNFGCWHHYLEMSSSSPTQDPYSAQNYNPCNSYCPYCTNTISNIVKMVDRQQLSLFLVESMTNTTKVYTPIQLGDELYKYNNCGKLIYRRKHSQKPNAKSDCYMTIVQLILAYILRLKYDEENMNKSYCILPHNNAIFNYSNDYHWHYIKHW